MKKILIIFAILFSFFIGCGNSVSGKYYSDGGSVIGSIEFKEGKAFIEYPMFRMSVPFPYEVKSNKVYITDPHRGSVSFEIIDRKTLKCDMVFMKGLYKKK